MTLEEYKEGLREEWRFHKRHPEMFLPWIIVILSLLYSYFGKFP